jgi:hypothetical protein
VQRDVAACTVPNVLAVTFQIVALTLDANGNVIKRRVVPVPIKRARRRSQQSSVIVSTFTEAGYEPAQKFWRAIDHDGDRTRFIIEGVTSYRSCPAVVGRFRKQPPR